MSEYNTWKGKLFENYTKDELIDIVKQTCKYYESRLKNRQHESEVLWEIIRAKRIGPIAKFFGRRK